MTLSSGIDRKSRDAEELLLQAIPANIAILDKEGAVIRTNDAWVAFGKSSNKWVGVGINYLAVCDAAKGEHAEYFRKLAAGIRRVIAGQCSRFSLDFPYRSAAGKRWIGSHITPLHGDGPGCVLLLFVDITERKRTEEALQKAHGEMEERVHARTEELQQINAALRTSEERFRQMAENIREIFWLADISPLRICYISPAFDEVWGRPREELYRDPHAFLDTIHPEDREKVYQAAFAYGNAQSAEGFEYRIIRPDGTIRWIAHQGAPILDCVGKPYRIAGAARDVTERKRMGKEILEISEFEKRRLGQDLHADICRRLEGISRAETVLAEELEGMGLDQAAAAKEIAALITTAAQRARSLAMGLSPMDLVNGGFMRELQILTANTSIAYGTPCALDCTSPVVLEDGMLATHLFRIIQEALTNAAAHGKARRITVSLAQQNGILTLSVSDDGIGFRFPLETGSTMGLSIMKYRAHQVGGSLTVQSAQGKGTTVTCSVSLPYPLPASAASPRRDSVEAEDFLALRTTGLTARECEVLYWIAQGKRDGEIATILSNSARTINHHVSSVIRKLDVESRTAAAIRALELLETTPHTQN